MKEIYVGMGCFWGYEHLYNELLPEVSTQVGYLTCSQLREPVEVIKIDINTNYIANVFEVFFNYHYCEADPLFPVPDKYHSVIFCEDLQLSTRIKEICKQWEKNNSKTLRTIIGNDFDFYPAHEKHQKRYLRDATICFPKRY